jgi:hypothetical protein
VRWVFNELGFIFEIMPSFELALNFQERSFEESEPFLTQRLHACLYREDVKFSHLHGARPRGVLALLADLTKVQYQFEEIHFLVFYQFLHLSLRSQNCLNTLAHC